MKRQIVSLVFLCICLSGLAHSQTYAFKNFRTGQSEEETSRNLTLMGYSPLACEPFDKDTGSKECTATAKLVPNEMHFVFNSFGLTGLRFDFPSSQFKRFLNEMVALNGKPTKSLYREKVQIHFNSSHIVEWRDREQSPCELMQIIQNSTGTDTLFIEDAPLTISGFPH
jgi:hypothetical protein